MLQCRLEPTMSWAYESEGPNHCWMKEFSVGSNPQPSVQQSTPLSTWLWSFSLRYLPKISGQTKVHVVALLLIVPNYIYQYMAQHIYTKEPGYEKHIFPHPVEVVNILPSTTLIRICPIYEIHWIRLKITWQDWNNRLAWVYTGDIWASHYFKCSTS